MFVAYFCHCVLHGIQNPALAVFGYLDLGEYHCNQLSTPYAYKFIYPFFLSFCWGLSELLLCLLLDHLNITALVIAKQALTNHLPLIGTRQNVFIFSGFRSSLKKFSRYGRCNPNHQLVNLYLLGKVQVYVSVVSLEITCILV